MPAIPVESRYRPVLPTLLSMLTFALLSVPVLARDSGDSAPSLADQYRAEAGQILGAALVDEEGWEKIDYLATVIGHRLSGSPQLEEAIDWAYRRMREEGLENVRKQPVTVPHWVRGEERLEVVTPVPRELDLLGLGGSVGTPPAGLTAPVVTVESFEELEGLDDDEVAGRIVVWAVDWQGYGRTVQYRLHGASRAAERGAVASLVRSATGASLDTPHTGALRYADGVPRIPAAAITVEDALWFRRMAEHGREVTLRLEMGARTLPDAQSANLIAEIAGSEAPEEVVVMGGHYDSWDAGQGVHDDGAACVAAWQALKILKDLGLRPRRTLRVVLWTNEENGLAGGRTYRESLGDAIDDHVAALEMDGGAERPVGFGLGIVGVDAGSDDAGSGEPVYEEALARLRDVARLFRAIDADRISRGGGGADIGPLMRDGVPGMAFRTVGEHYFDWHHTKADTLDKLEPENLQRAIAMMAVMGYVLADMPERLVPAGWRPPNPEKDR